MCVQGLPLMSAVAYIGLISNSCLSSWLSCFVTFPDVTHQLVSASCPRAVHQILAAQSQPLAHVAPSSSHTLRRLQSHAVQSFSTAYGYFYAYQVKYPANFASDLLEDYQLQPLKAKRAADWSQEGIQDR